MDDARFDALVRSAVRDGTSRRRVLKALAGAALGALLGGRAREAGIAQTSCGLVGATCAATTDCCPGSVCTAQRRCTCRTGFAACPVPGGSRCFNLQANRNHCGTCATRCAEGEVCSKGKCCRQGLTNCNGVCRNLRTDNGNCGGCGTQCFVSGSRFCACGTCVFCPLGARLNQTTCSCDCPPGQRNCGGVCRDALNDPNNCGACGRKCPTDVCGRQVCRNGTCCANPAGGPSCTGCACAAAGDTCNAQTCCVHGGTGACRNGVCP